MICVIHLIATALLYGILLSVLVLILFLCMVSFMEPVYKSYRASLVVCSCAMLYISTVALDILVSTAFGCPAVL